VSQKAKSSKKRKVLFESNLELSQKLLSAVFSKIYKAEKAKKAVVLQKIHSTNEMHNLLMKFTFFETKQK
jgi:hypothetical protein